MQKLNCSSNMWTFYYETLHMNTKQMGTGHQGNQLGPGPTQTSERLTELPLACLGCSDHLSVMLMPAFRPPFPTLVTGSLQPSGPGHAAPADSHCPSSAQNIITDSCSPLGGASTAPGPEHPGCPTVSYPKPSQ